MSSANFKLDKFEGPLDLLLHLVAKHKLDIYDIEISLLLDQYLEYLENLEHEDYEQSAEFLAMAARLVYIKSSQLLPREENEPDLKKELEGKMIEYSLCKIAAGRLKERYIGDKIFVRQPQKVPVDKTYKRQHFPDVLVNAYMGLSEKAKRAKPLKADMFKPIVSHKIVSVTSKIIFVLKKLYVDGECSLDNLYDGINSKSERVATFLAILELTKSGRIFLNDDNSMIYFNRDKKRRKNNSVSDSADEPDEDNYEVSEDTDEVDKEIIPEQNREQEQEQNQEHEYKPMAEFMPMVMPMAVTVLAVVPKKAEISDISDNFSEIHENIAEDTLIDIPAEQTQTEPEQIGQEFENIMLNEKTADDYEIKILINEKTKACIKKNYWNKLKYFWGVSKIGDDGRNNYWRYG